VEWARASDASRQSFAVDELVGHVVAPTDAAGFDSSGQKLVLDFGDQAIEREKAVKTAFVACGFVAENSQTIFAVLARGGVCHRGAPFAELPRDDERAELRPERER